MFPGLYCPGLIEAMEELRAHILAHPGFRGSIAPASLKRQRPCLPCQVARRFRGSIAPASLKLLGQSGSLAYMACFRGSIAPASLKRGGGGVGAEALDEVSGALLPRPH